MKKYLLISLMTLSLTAIAACTDEKCQENINNNCVCTIKAVSTQCFFCEVDPLPLSINRFSLYEMAILT